MDCDDQKNIIPNSSQNSNLRTSQNLFTCIYPVIAFDVVLWPARNKNHFINQLVSLTEFYQLSIASTYCEIIRSCIVGLVDATGTTDHAKWAVFIFLKLPSLLRELGQQYYTRNQTIANTNATTVDNVVQIDQKLDGQTIMQKFPQDLKCAIERLLCYTPLFDLADFKCNCDFLDCLIQELCKTVNSCDSVGAQLLMENLQPLSQKRREFLQATRTSAFVAVATGTGQGPGLFKILQAEPTLSTILLDVRMDPNCVSDDAANEKYVKILCQLVNGKTFELSLAASAATGNLQELTRRLIEINQEASNLQNPVLFDITFLILAHIGHHYGLEALGHHEQNVNASQKSYFVQWFLHCYHHETMISCPNLMLKSALTDVTNSTDSKEKEKIDLIVKQLIILASSTQPVSLTMKTPQLDSWRQIGTYLPAAIRHILEAWQADKLDDASVKLIIDRIKARTCCLILIIATWLRVYIRTLSDNERAKPLQMMQELMRSNSNSPTSSSTSNTNLGTTGEENQDSKIGILDGQNPNQSVQANAQIPGQSESHRARASLMSHLVKKMLLELQQNSSNLNLIQPCNSNSSASNLINSTKPTQQQATILSSSTSTIAPSCNLNQLIQNSNLSVSSLMSSSLAIGSSSSASGSTNQFLSDLKKKSSNLSVSCQAVNRRFYNCHVPARDLLDAQLLPSLERGWIDGRAVHNINALLRHVCSPDWFVDNVCTRVLRHESPSDLAQSIDLALGLFHLDIRACAHALVTHTVMRYLGSTGLSMLMMQPRAEALARLTVITLACADSETRSLSKIDELTSTNSHQQKLAPAFVPSTKIKFEPMDVDNEQKNLPPNDNNNVGLSKGLNYNEWDKKLNLAVRQLVALLRTILDSPRMTQRSLFPVCFIQQMLECGQRGDVSILKRHVPNCMIEAAAKIMANDCFMPSSATNATTTTTTITISSNVATNNNSFTLSTMTNGSISNGQAPPSTTSNGITIGSN